MRNFLIFFKTSFPLDFSIYLFFEIVVEKEIIDLQIRIKKKNNRK